MNKKLDKFYGELDKLSLLEDKYESLYNFIIYNKSIAEFINYLFEYLKKIKHISNVFKKKYLNDRIYFFIEFLKEEEKINKDNNCDKIINRIYFV